MTRVLVTGGAGFVGANLSVSLAQRQPDWEVVALDNLMRRGSELNLPRLVAAGVRFLHGDVRQPDDLARVPEIAALVECSAEPSVSSGYGEAARYLVETNLTGAANCLDLARRDRAHVVFLSTSRVYPLAALDGLALREGESRFELEDEQPLPGASAAGISESFPLVGARTLYGATKLAAELLIAEYVEQELITAVVDRCGVIAGPWQMGRVDQGVFAFWMLHHYFGLPLRYIGYGGSGKQVRDLLHVDDLCDLVAEQLLEPQAWNGVTVNVGGGAEVSLSLREATHICEEITGRTVPIEGVAERRPGDVAVYLSDIAQVTSRSAWRPRRGSRDIMGDVFEWARANETALAMSLGIARRP